MAELETKVSSNWAVKLFIALGIIVLAAPVVYVAAVTIGLKAHLKEDCGMQLRNIAERCREHAARHEGKFPAKWSDLEWGDMGGIENTTWNRQFVCPTVGHGVGNWQQIDLWSDYRLIAGRTTNDAPDTVLAIEPISNHKSGVNVLFVDGSSTWLPISRVLEQTGPPTASP
jgi:prepilin-type processing-associated H-X9-DG protein